jgi:hypothetical protein
MKSFLLVCLAYCIPAFGHNSDSYKPSHASDILGFKLPIIGESMALVYQAENFYIRGNRTYKLWLPQKPFVQNLKKDLAPYDPDWTMTGLPQVRRVYFDALLDEFGQYKFQSAPMIVKNYILVNKEYRLVPRSKKKRSIVFEGYKVGKNIVLTEKFSYKVENASLLPVIYPANIKDVYRQDAVDLKISEPYKIYEMRRRPNSRYQTV